MAPEPPASAEPPAKLPASTETPAKTEAADAEKTVAQVGQQSGQEGGQQTPQYFYMPNAQGSYTLMKTISPQNNATENGTDAANQVGQAPKQVDSK